jgi:multidrug resistance efflux pump
MNSLKLADVLEKIYGLKVEAAELRRLHQSEKEGWRYAKELDQERNRLEGINAELVEAVKAALSDDQPYIEKCKASIARATGENNG